MVKNIIAGLFIITTVSLIGCNYSNINEKQEEQGIESSEEGIDKPLNSAVSEVLLDNEIVKILCTGIDDNRVDGTGIIVEIENKSDKTIVIEANQVSVDNLMYDPVFKCEVVAKGKKSESIVFFDDSIDELKNIEGFFNIFDKDSMNTVGSYSFKILIDENSKGYSLSDNGLILVDNEVIKCVYVGQGEDKVFGKYIELEIENKVGDDIVAQIREVSINGNIIDPLFISEITAGKISKGKVKFYEKDFDELKDIEGKIHVFYSGSGDTIGEYPFSIIE